ncbi:MAG: Rieske 2Fe-2S domain-containing protein [Magnetococcales bacterium]|nr:Rieske 2Fe-2S domain-containing protein [Magnetococcales bacterium]
MKEWMDVLPEVACPPGTLKPLIVDGLEVLIVNLGGVFYGLEDCCSHDGDHLSDGDMEDGAIICPRHGARFDLKTGAVLSPPAYEDINVVPVRVSHGMIQVQH